MRAIAYAFILIALIQSSLCQRYSSCQESVGRTCPYLQNRTDYLLNMKKGGSDVLSASPYLYSFFLCEQYNFDCGYVKNSGDPLTVSNGVKLNINESQLRQITTVNGTFEKIKPYIGLGSEEAICGSGILPLELTPIESKEVLEAFMEKLEEEVVASYNLCRNSSTTKVWSGIKINIKTAVLSRLKDNKELLGDSEFWHHVCINDFEGVSEELKGFYEEEEDVLNLHEAYLIDSVTQKCDKMQSINFLVDESGSIGDDGFNLALNFLELYINSTNDDFSIMSIHFYATVFDQYITFGHDYDYILRMIQNKGYARQNTLTGLALNETIKRIIAHKFPLGVPKIIAILTDGQSLDSVIEASEYARQNEITILAVGITAGINYNQLLEMAGNPSNIITVASYGDLPKLIDFIPNYFCKQITTINLGETIEGIGVRVPSSPSFFQVIKGVTEYYQLDIFFEDDPVAHNQQIHESQLDPFPDRFTESLTSESYEIFVGQSPRTLQAQPAVDSGFVPMKVYFISPQHQEHITTKKYITQQVNASTSYISIRGNDLRFNISLKKCASSTCKKEKEYYLSLSNVGPVEVYHPKAEDLSIFIAIGCTLGALACLCSLSLFALRRRSQKELEDRKSSKKLMERNSEDGKTNEYFDENLIPATTYEPCMRPEQKSGGGQSGSEQGSCSQSKSRTQKSESNKASKIS